MQRLLEFSRKAGDENLCFCWCQAWVCSVFFRFAITGWPLENEGMKLYMDIIYEDSFPTKGQPEYGLLAQKLCVCVDCRSLCCTWNYNTLKDPTSNPHPNLLSFLGGKSPAIWGKGWWNMISIWQHDAPNKKQLLNNATSSCSPLKRLNNCHDVRPVTLDIFWFQVTFYGLGSHGNITKSPLNWVVVSNIFLILTPIWGRFPFRLVFFKWVETTN